MPSFNLFSRYLVVRFASNDGPSNTATDGPLVPTSSRNSSGNSSGNNSGSIQALRAERTGLSFYLASQAPRIIILALSRMHLNVLHSLYLYVTRPYRAFLCFVPVSSQATGANTYVAVQHTVVA